MYSAARVNMPFYCLGLLELVGDDPMEYQSWRKRRDGCVFHQNAKEGVFGTGHASFTVSSSEDDGVESWLVYHAQTEADPSGEFSTLFFFFFLSSLYCSVGGSQICIWYMVYGSWLTVYFLFFSNQKANLYRTIRTQKFTWNEEDGTPIFPAAANGPFPVPKGQVS